MEENTVTIRGITFSKDELTIITLDKLKSYQLCPGHLYYFSKVSNKFIFMLQAGDFIEESFIKKYEEGGFKSFYILNFINEENIEKFKYYLSQFKIARKEADRWSERNEIIDFFKLNYVITQKNSLLEFVIAFNETFSKVPSYIFEKYLATSDVLLRRSVINGCFASFIALTVGYMDYQFVQDMFHAALLKDIGLMSEQFNYSVLKACELERKTPGEGRKYLTGKESSLKFFENHPYESVKIVESQLKGIFNYDETIDSILFHHELSDGSGFPKGINYLSVSDWESILNLVEYITPYEEIIFSKQGDYHLLTLIENAQKEGVVQKLPAHRVFGMLKAILSSGMEKEVREA